MRIVIALGGNALLRRGEPLTEVNQRSNVHLAAERIAGVAAGNELVIAHGNGPQVGLLALQSQGDQEGHAYPLDVLGAETEAMIGYLIEQELGNALPAEQPIATLLTMVEVDPDDQAFDDPTKFIGPVYEQDEAERLAGEHGWTVKQDGDKLRRVVASPKPKRILELEAIRALVDRGVIVVCAGGGGIPTVLQDRVMRGVEAVIDKDLASSLLARQLEADLLLIATDVDGIYLDWGTERERRLDAATTDELESLSFPAGSMGPKVEAAVEFVRATGNEAVIGSLGDIEGIVRGEQGGTRVRPASG